MYMSDHTRVISSNLFTMSIAFLAIRLLMFLERSFRCKITNKKRVAGCGVCFIKFPVQLMPASKEINLRFLRSKTLGCSLQ